MLSNGSAGFAHRYDAVGNVASENGQHRLVTRGPRRTSSTETRSLSRQGFSDLTVRVQAVCPNIHCPSCISYLSSLVSSLRVDPSANAHIVNVDTSLIDRTVHFDLLISSTGAQAGPSSFSRSTGSARAVSALLTRMLKEIASILAQDGFPVDHLRSKLVTPSTTNHAFRDALSSVLDASDLYEEEACDSSPRSLPKDARHSTSFERSNSVLGGFSALFGSTLRSAWSRAVTSDHALARGREERWRKHLQVCEACQEEDTISRESSSSASSGLQNGTHRGTDDAAQRVVATLSISGMTCASCAQSITKAVQAESSLVVDAFDINVMSASASVTTHPSTIQKIVETIDDAGFEAEVVKVEPVSRIRSQEKLQSYSTWTAKLSIEGMTCASCVQSITSAVRSFTDKTNPEAAVNISHFSVNLMGKAADVKLSTGDTEHDSKAAVRKRLQEVIAEIEDIGFDAELLTLQYSSAPKGTSTDTGNTDGSLQRTVRIRVEGMFCQTCVNKVRDYFANTQAANGSDIELDNDDLDAFTLSKPYISFSYKSGPDSRIRLRDTLADIDQLDPSFEAHYDPPASLASRSAVLARKELRDLLMRLSIAAIFAVLSLVISMIAPVLPPSHSLRQYLSEYVVGSATRGEIAMWLISSPVQFGVGSIFFKKAWRSTSSVWKKGRSWSDRLFRFGNMDVLVALGTLVAYTSSLAFLIIDAFRDPQSQRKRANKPGRDSMQAEMGMTYFEVSVFLVFFILLGRALESISKKKTGDAVADLGKMKPSSAYLVIDASNPTQSKTEIIDVDMLEVGDLVLVPYGSSPPLDGAFVGTSTGKGDAQGLLDESSLSGEARPVSKKIDDQVFAGTINVSPTAIFVRVGVLPGSCMIDEILDVVQESAGKKASIAQLADRITGVFVPTIVYLSLFVFLLWTMLLYSGALSEGWQAKHVPHYGEPGAKILCALQFGISCLLVACPCGIGLAAPTSQLAGIGLASKHGILVNGGGEAFKAASAAARGNADLVVVFDKTGTITKGEAVKVTSHCFASKCSSELAQTDEDALLRCIDLAEQSSTHPYATALRDWIAQQRKSRDDSPPSAQPKLVEISEVAGKGLRATFEGFGKNNSERLLLVGNKSLMNELDGASYRTDEAIKCAEKKWQEAANSVIYVGVKASKEPGEVRLAMALSDEIRPEAKWVVSHLTNRFRAEVWMVSGDNESTALGVASQVGIPPSRVVAGVLPVQKKEWVEKLRLPSPSPSPHDFPSGQGRPSPSRKPRTVCFVGDGINDSPALSSASLGIALGSGSSIAHSSSDFILLRRHSPLLSLPLLLTLSKATYSKIWSNFAWAFVFNLCLIPIASGALVGVGIGLGPALSGLAMAFSSTSVVLNSLTLRWWKPEAEVRKRIEEAENES